MAKLNPSSVNTIRLITIMVDGESIVLSACVRIGKLGSRVDNFSSGGIGCGIQPDGRLNSFGFTQKGERLGTCSNGFPFSEGKIPNWDKVLQTVKRLHYCVPVFGVANWDICIDHTGEPVLIEYNVSQGGIDLHQYNNGPLYGNYREEIISGVFKNWKKQGAALDFNYYIQKHCVTIQNGSKLISQCCIPAEIEGEKVTFIGESSFEGRKKLEAVRFLGDLLEIQYCAFYGCRKLREVTFEGACETIGRSAFNSCTELKSIILPVGLKTISTRSFKDCPALSRVAIPPSVIRIADDAFEGSQTVSIVGRRASYAEEYAKKHNIRFIVE